jgi:hypothetical protein
VPDGVPPRLTGLAARQWGLVTLPQLGRGHAPRHAAEAAVAAGHAAWVIPHRVLHVDGFPPPRNPRLAAVWLLMEDHPADERRPPFCAVASHRSALQLYGLPGLSGPAHEFTGAPMRLRALDGVWLHPGRLVDGEWRVVDGIPVTSPVRTVRDFAASPDVDDGELQAIVSRFVRRGLACEDELALAAAHGRKETPQWRRGIRR